MSKYNEQKFFEKIDFFQVVSGAKAKKTPEPEKRVVEKDFETT